MRPVIVSWELGLTSASGVSFDDSRDYAIEVGGKAHPSDARGRQLVQERTLRAARYEPVCAVDDVSRLGGIPYQFFK
jgi:hypothetical protein